MDADQRRRGMNVAHHERHQTLDGAFWVTSRLCLVPRSFEAEDAEVAPTCWKIGFSDLSYAFECHAFILRVAPLKRLDKDADRRYPSKQLARMTPTTKIVPAEGEAAVAAVRTLLLEYWDSFGFTPCFQNFGEEVASLPGAYARPDGRLALATVDGEPAGCIALRRVDEHRAEAKRLYVRPAFRGSGLGRALLEWVMAEARDAGYREIVGDTMPVMREALALYDRMGFERRNAATGQEPISSQAAQEPILIRIPL